MYSRIDYPQYECLLVITTQVKKENIANTLEDTLYSCSLSNHCTFFSPKVIGYFDFQHHHLFMCAYVIYIHMKCTCLCLTYFTSNIACMKFILIVTCICCLLSFIVG